MSDATRNEEPGVRRLGREQVPEVTRVLSESFADYPVMRYVLGTDGEYRQRLDTLIGMFVMARVLRNEPLLGVPEAQGLGAAALVTDPSGPETPPEFSVLREEVWAKLGPDSRARYEAFGAAWEDFPVREPHLHLNMIGVDPRSQGRGLARLLLEHVHELSRKHPTSQGVSLTTEVPRNLALYEHFGYAVRKHVRVSSELETWAMFRLDSR